VYSREDWRPESQQPSWTVVTVGRRGGRAQVQQVQMQQFPPQGPYQQQPYGGGGGGGGYGQHQPYGAQPYGAPYGQPYQATQPYGAAPALLR